MRDILREENLHFACRWKVPVFFKFWNKYHYEFVHHHHDAEELVYFPWISTKASLAPKLSADHAGLLRAMDAVSACAAPLHVAGVGSGDAAAWDRAAGALREAFARYQDSMLEHLAEEEEAVPSVLRAHFTEEEEGACVERIMKGLDLGTLRRMLPWIVDAMEKWNGADATQAFVGGLPAPLRLMYRAMWKGAFTRKNRGLLELLESPYASDVPRVKVPDWGDVAKSEAANNGLRGHDDKVPSNAAAAGAA